MNPGTGKGIFRSWFSLTHSEQRAAALVAGIFLLGLAVWAWHTTKENGDDAKASPPPIRAHTPKAPRN